MTYGEVFVTKYGAKLTLTGLYGKFRAALFCKIRRALYWAGCRCSTRPSGIEVCDAGIRNWLEYSTINLLFLRGPVNSPTEVLTASGVLMAIGNRHFILTAGHVVQAAKNYDHLALLVQKDPHRFTIPIPYGNFVYRPDPGRPPLADYGYFILDLPTVNTLEAKNRAFLGLDRILPPENLSPKVWTYVFGFPEGIATNKPPTGYGSRHLAYATTVVDKWRIPNPSLLQRLGLPDEVDFWIPKEGNRMLINGGNIAMAVPDFPGVSGGSMWKVKWRSDDATWSPSDNMCLAAIAFYWDPELWVSCSGEWHGFVRGVSPRRHLQLIFDFHSDLQDVLKPYLGPPR